MMLPCIPQGRILARQALYLPLGTEAQALALPQLAAGAYLLELHQGDLRTQHKLVVQ